MIRARVSLGMALGLASIVPGCGGPGPPPKVHLRVAAASDLEHALPLLISAFKLESEAEVDASFGASGQLAEQIRQGSPMDVFLSADRKFVDRLASEGIIRPDSVRPYARGALVLALSAKSDRKVGSLADLADPGIKFIAIANPETAPYGMAAKQAMERAGVYDAVKARLVPAGSVRQALQMVQSGNADVGIVGRSLADTPGIRSVALPVDASDPIVQYLGIVAKSEHPQEASAFVDFLLSEDGQGMFSTLGFSRATGAGGVVPQKAGSP